MSYNQVWRLASEGRLNYDVSDDRDWITTSYSDGFTIDTSPWPPYKYHRLYVGDTGIINVAINPSGLAEGPHTGTITIKAGQTTKSIPVTFTVNPASEKICGDGIDNDCDGVVDEGCGKILSRVSEATQEVEICNQTDPLMVKVEDGGGNPKDKTGIFWNYSSTPTGSSGERLFHESNETNEFGLAENWVVVGDHAGDYVVHSKCNDCTEGSPQTFTVKATCPDDIPVFRQYNYKDEPYDSSCKKYEEDANGNLTVVGSRLCNDGDLREDRRTISQKGCALTSLAMVLSKYEWLDLGSIRQTPLLDTKLKNIEENERGQIYKGYVGAGNISWYAIALHLKDLYGVEYKAKIGKLKTKKITKNGQQVKVVDEDLSVVVDKKKMDQYLNQCAPVIVKVFNSTTGNAHWVLVIAKNGNDYRIIDPNYNDRKKLSHYKDIYRMFVYKPKNGGCP